MAKARQDFEILYIIPNLHATMSCLKYLKIILKTSVLLSGNWKFFILKDPNTGTAQCFE